jgi:hypothetical protein
MNVVERIKNHPLYAFAVLLIPIIVSVWLLSEALRVNPKQEQIALREAQKADLERQVAALKEQVAAKDRQILTLKEQVAKSAALEQSSSTNPKKPDSLETPPQKSTPGSQISKQEPMSSAQPSRKKDALNLPIQTRFDGIVVSIIRFEKTGGFVMLQLMARNTLSARHQVCFYPMGTKLVHEATGQSWQPKEYTGQECTQLEANKSSHMWMRFDVPEPENKVFSLSSPLFNETLNNLVLAESS